MHRIYFDPNEGDEHGNFDLGIPGSAIDIEAAGEDLREGLHVILYDEAPHESQSASGAAAIRSSSARGYEPRLRQFSSV